MLIYPDISPVAVAIGPFEVHWYGLMYLVAFVTGWWLGVIRTRRPGTEWRAAEISDLVFYFALGAILGGRIGYTLMYNFSGFIDEPTVIFKIWQGGMSYHGGMIGVFVSMWLYGRHTGRSFFQVTDFLAPLVPLGLGAGRLGNFINGELWGSPTTLPWGMVFPFVDVRDLNRDPVESLTGRERALLAALARGLNNKALAAEFSISVNTVKFHLRNLYDKLSVTSRAQAIAFYYAANIKGPNEAD